MASTVVVDSAPSDAALVVEDDACSSSVDDDKDSTAVGDDDGLSDGGVSAVTGPTSSSCRLASRSSAAVDGTSCVAVDEVSTVSGLSVLPLADSVDADERSAKDDPTAIDSSVDASSCLTVGPFCDEIYCNSRDTSIFLLAESAMNPFIL